MDLEGCVEEERKRQEEEEIRERVEFSDDMDGGDMMER